MNIEEYCNKHKIDIKNNNINEMIYQNKNSNSDISKLMYMNFINCKYQDYKCCF
jgi:hypothetical protein